MPKFFITPFADNGTRTAVPEISQADGSVSYPQGYPTNYERDLDTDPLALPIERAKFNQVLNDITGSLQDQQIYSLPPFITSEMNNGAAYAYPLFGVCRYDDGTGLKGYMSIIANNTTAPSAGGVTQTGWQKILDPQNGLVFKNDLATAVLYGIMRFATNAEAEQGLLNNVAVTPAQLLKAGSQVGDEKTWRGAIAPGGWLFLRGQAVSRTVYADLYNFAVANNIIVPDSVWQADKMYGLYSHGDGASTFRLPDMRGMYLCGFESAYHSLLGKYSPDQNKNHTHQSWSFVTYGGSVGYDNRGGHQLWYDTTAEGGERAQPRTIPVNWVVKF